MTYLFILSWNIVPWSYICVSKSNLGKPNNIFFLKILTDLFQWQFLITYISSVLRKFGACLHLGSVRWLRSKEHCFRFTYTFLALFCCFSCHAHQHIYKNCSKYNANLEGKNENFFTSFLMSFLESLKFFINQVQQFICRCAAVKYQLSVQQKKLISGVL